MCFSLLCPDAVADSVFDLDFPALRALGYTGLIFDIDNTLVPHGADAVPEVEALFRRLETLGFRVFFVSDNGPDRIRRFLTNIRGDFIDNAHKPLPGAYRRAVKALGLRRREVLVIGDQIFTDVLGARLAGLHPILVRFIGWRTDPNPGKRRALEARILARWEKKRRTHLQIQLEAATHETTKDPVL